MKWLAVAILLTLAVVSLCQNDTTLEHEAYGAAVVENVVSKLQAACVFDDIGWFLRRLSYVETHDGQRANTYPDDYHGGLWKVSSLLNIPFHEIVV